MKLRGTASEGPLTLDLRFFMNVALPKKEIVDMNC